MRMPPEHFDGTMLDWMTQEVFRDSDLSPGYCLFCDAPATGASLFGLPGKLTRTDGSVHTVNLVQYVGHCRPCSRVGTERLERRTRDKLVEAGILKVGESLRLMPKNDPAWKDARECLCCS